MFAAKKVVYCPVGDHVELGYFIKGKVSSFVCRECKFIFTWDKDGKLLQPLRINPEEKRVRKYCTREGCVCRD